MKKVNIFVMAIVAAALLSFSMPTMAEAKGGKNPCAKNPCAENPCAEKVKKHGHYKGNHDKEHHDTKLEMMGILKETLTIIKGLNHTPTDAEKKQLGDMIERLTEMEKKCKEKKKECSTKWRDKEGKDGKAHGE